MGKIKLQVDAIVVASFEAGAAAPRQAQGLFATPDCPLTVEGSCWCSEQATCLCN